MKMGTNPYIVKAYDSRSTENMSAQSVVGRLSLLCLLSCGGSNASLS